MSECLKCEMHLDLVAVKCDFCLSHEWKCASFSCLLSSACKLGFGRVWMLSFVSTWYSFPMQVLVVHTSCEMWDCEMRISACVAQAGDCRDFSSLSRSLIRCTYTMKISLHFICCSCKICRCVCVCASSSILKSVCPVSCEPRVSEVISNTSFVKLCEYVSMWVVIMCDSVRHRVMYLAVCEFSCVIRRRLAFVFSSCLVSFRSVVWVVSFVYSSPVSVSLRYSVAVRLESVWEVR